MSECKICGGRLKMYDFGGVCSKPDCIKETRKQKKDRIKATWREAWQYKVRLKVSANNCTGQNLTGMGGERQTMKLGFTRAADILAILGMVLGVLMLALGLIGVFGTGEFEFGIIASAGFVLIVLSIFLGVLSEISQSLAK